MTVRSLFVGLTGINAMSQGIDVISNNIANINTVGFRAGRASFDDLFYRTLSAGVGATEDRGGINPRQLGHGVTTGSIDTIFTQGSIQSTGRLLDMSIQGEGFFVLRNGAGQEFLTRGGNFTLDNEGKIVDPSTGLRLIGRPADEDGQILDTEAEGELEIDFSKRSVAKQTENVTARGNFDARVGNPDSDASVSFARSTSTLTGIFNEGGSSIGLVNGDVLKFDSGFFELGNPPDTVQSPLNLAELDAGKGAGVILSITQSTTVEDMQRALNNFFQTAISDITPGESSGLNFSFIDGGSFDVNSAGNNALSGVRVGLATRFGETNPPVEASRNVGNLFVNNGDPDFSKTLNVRAQQTVQTQEIRKADTTTSIDIFDSQGDSHTLTVGMARDTQAPAAIQNSLIGELSDAEGRKLIPSDVIPAPPTFSEPALDSRDNTAVFTATQISNIVATQGVYSFQDGAGNLVAMRLTDGALSFNGGQFNVPVNADGTIKQFAVNAGLDVTGEEILNVASADNPGGGLLGDQGFEPTTTLEDIRSQLERRINAAIGQVVGNIGDLDIASADLVDPPALALTSPADFQTGANQPVSITLSDDGSFSFSVANGSLGALSTDDQAVIDNFKANNNVEDDDLGLVLDLAAKTRTVRVSTINPGALINDPADDQPDGQVDDSFVGDGLVTGFKRDADPFGANIQNAFDIGSTDFGNFDTDEDPTADPPTGIDDSGVQLVALSSGVLGNNDELLAQRFNNHQAFEPETTAFRALFNQRGFGIAQDFDSTAGVDSPTGVPVGIVSKSTDVTPFEINTIHTGGLTRNTVNFQTTVPSDFRTPPVNHTGTLVFDTEGRFQSYDGTTVAPTISFDPDNNDPENGGVNPIPFKLDLSGITFQSGTPNVQLDTQDGRPTGNLDNVSIAASGEIIGVFTNGDTQSLGQIRLATVRNESGLIQEVASMFTVGPNSGERIFADAGIDAGAVNSGSLELSNVDLAQEFTNLIVVQRAYQANTRVITTGDQILQEALTLKR